MKWALGLGVLAALGAGGLYWWNTTGYTLRVTTAHAVEELARIAYAAGAGPLRDRAERLLAAVAASSKPYLTLTQGREYDALRRETSGGVAGFAGYLQ